MTGSVDWVGVWVGDPVDDVPVSALTGEGIDGLRRRILQTIAPQGFMGHVPGLPIPAHDPARARPPLPAHEARRFEVHAA